MLSTYVPTNQPTYLPIYQCTYLSTYYLPTHLPAYLPAYLPTYLPICLPTYLSTCLPTCLSAYLPACLPTYLPTYLLARLLAYLLNYLHAYWIACLLTCLDMTYPVDWAIKTTYLLKSSISCITFPRPPGFFSVVFFFHFSCRSSLRGWFSCHRHVLFDDLSRNMALGLHPNTQNVHKNAVCYDKTQHASFRGNPLIKLQNDT